jgi:hypothetical protein
MSVTPTNIKDISIGTHQIKLTLLGNVDLNDTIIIKPGENVVNYELKPIPVLPPPPITETIQINGSSIMNGRTLQLIVYTNLITWSSSDTTIATISQDGLVTALKSGTVTITARTKNTQSTKKLIINKR